MAYFAGIDGGGTKTACAVGDDLRVLGRGLAGASKVARVGSDAARQSLAEALMHACAEAKISLADLSRVCLGVAGAARSEVVRSMTALMGEIVACPVEIVGDMVIALEAAFNGRPGVIVISGTGSICYGRNEHGQTARAGGWGSLISDEGSGEWVGRRMVQLALRAHDGGEHTALLAALFAAWKIATRDEVSHFANTNPPPDFSKLFPRVAEAAHAGDALGQRILMEAGEELATLAATVLKRLWPSGEQAQVRTLGGVFQNSNLVRESFVTALGRLRPATAISDEEVDPVLGALMLARSHVVVEASAR